jgi:uncharacterized protein YdeI (YjbR/CyaY-like superfamily)
MKDFENLFFTDASSFRKWLKENYDKSPGIWLTFYKSHSGKECIKHGEALDTALCYGWIDSIIKRTDEFKYVVKFTPRTNTSKWSDANKKRVIELIRDGKMTDAGLKKIDIYLKTGKVSWEIAERPVRNKDHVAAPEYLLGELSKNEPALSNFLKLAPYNQRLYILWVTSAKREDTIRRRLAEAVELLKGNRKLGLK